MEIQALARKPEIGRDPMRVALLGFGTVGGGVYARLAAAKERYDVVAILVRDLRRHEVEGAVRRIMTTDPDAVFDASPDVVVEVMGGIDHASGLIQRALSSGADVATANKALMAREFDGLHELARTHDARLCYSAAVGGGVPMFETVDDVRAHARVAALEGVLNGTCNFVLDRMREGDDFAAAVRRAQELGFAEADPSADVDGWDAAEKLVLLVRRAFDAALDVNTVPRRSLRELTTDMVREANAKGLRWRQISRCRRDGDRLEATVDLEMVAADHPLFGVEGEDNALTVIDDGGASKMVQGKGAGRWPTASSVLADIEQLYASRITAHHAA